MTKNNEPQTYRLVATGEKDTFAVVPSSVVEPMIYIGPITTANFIRNCDADPTKTYTVEADMTYKDAPISVKISGVSGESFRQGFQISVTPKIEE